MFSDDELIEISALQHWVFCRRRAALSYIEGAWEDNVATVEGTVLHERVHSGVAENRTDLRLRTSVRLSSPNLGITGVVDEIEYHRSDHGVHLGGCDGLWCPLPVEKKRGALHREAAYEVQLCAYGLCLEEIHGITLSGGAIFWHTTRRRQDVFFTDSLRKQTRMAISSLREFIAAGITPKPEPHEKRKKCKGCSFVDLCMPGLFDVDRSQRYWQRIFEDAKGCDNP